MVVQDPAQLRPGEISRQRQAGDGAEAIDAALVGQFVANGAGARVLPDDGVAVRRGGIAVPDDQRFALVGQPDRRDITGTGGGV